MPGKPTYEELEERVKELEKEAIARRKADVAPLQSNEKLETQLRQAQKMESIGTLAGGIAHDFNNILFPIFGYTEMAMIGMPEDSKARNYLLEVFRAANRAKDLIQQILTFSRQTEQERKPLRIQSIIKEALQLLRASIPSTIEIRQNIGKDCGPILADLTEIHQVMMNICTNAYQAMGEEGGVLEVNLREVEVDSNDLAFNRGLNHGTYLRLTVSDTGQGMECEVIERIFDPYFTTKSQGKGTGLGLAVVHGIVKSYEGHIIVHSEPDQGATFHVYFPRIDSCPVATKNLFNEPAPKGTEHILLVDDESQIIHMVQEMLERLGYQITARISSLDAFEMFCIQPDKFDLVITDQIMPEIMGTEFAQKLIGIRHDIPIILCTGTNDTITEKKARDIGIREYIMKPIVMSEIAKTIRRVLDHEVFV